MNFEEYLAEGAPPHTAATKIAKNLEAKAEKRKSDPDLHKLYKSDAKDWHKIATHISSGDHKKAAKHWANLDTASREHAADHPSLLKHLEKHL